MSQELRRISRRAVMEALGASAAALGLSGCGATAIGALGPVQGSQRHDQARALRFQCAQTAWARAYALTHPDNGDEALYPTRFASYSKGLPHDAVGVPTAGAYDALLAALSSGSPVAFEALTLGGTVKLTDPQAGLAFEMEGMDSHDVLVPPAPTFASAETAGEIVESWWMALCRDVPFSAWSADPTVAAACADLSALSDFRGPKVGGAVTPATVFRGFTAGDLVGPYLSQFLWRDVPFGAVPIVQKIVTTPPGVDHLTTFADWLASQNGTAPAAQALDPTPVYIRSLRDLGQWVHVDVLFQAGFQAALILLGLGAPLAAGIPYKTSTKQAGFGTWGSPHLQSLVGEVAVRALRSVLYQKWFVHRRIRPEEFAGRVHAHAHGMATYPVHADALGSAARAALEAANGTSLLPQAFVEGCPTHPSYGGGHATVAGATITVLKAWFDEAFVIPTPVEAAADGLSLVPYAGADAGLITVGGELDKLASNVGLGRDAAGVHWRSDYRESLLLGERIAIAILEEQKPLFPETHTFSFHRFDGTLVTI